MTMHKRVKLLLLHGETEKEPKKIKRFHNLKSWLHTQRETITEKVFVFNRQ